MSANKDFINEECDTMVINLAKVCKLVKASDKSRNVISNSKSHFLPTYIYVERKEYVEYIYSISNFLCQCNILDLV